MRTRLPRGNVLMIFAKRQFPNTLFCSCTRVSLVQLYFPTLCNILILIHLSFSANTISNLCACSVARLSFAPAGVCACHG